MTAAPDLIAPILGYRQWRLIRNERGEAELRSGGVGDAVWIPGVNRAECKLNTLAAAGTYSPTLDVAQSAEQAHQAPGTDCSCGIYATHLLEEPEDPTLPSGAIAAWGRIEVHRAGLRAEYARIVVLGMPETIRSDAQRELVVEAAARYGVRCVPAELVEEVAREAGAPVPSALRPQQSDDAYDYSPFSSARRGEPAGFGASVGRSLSALAGPARDGLPMGTRRRGPVYDPVLDDEGLTGEPTSQMAVFLGSIGLLAIIAITVLVASLL
jgi:hypothetical protein